MHFSPPLENSATTSSETAGKLSPLILGWFGLLFGAGILLWCVMTWAFVADDSYFYVVIARNIALNGEQTFSNLFPTNGFHPLWGYVLAAYTYLVHSVWPSAVYQIVFAVPLAVAMLVGTAYQSWRFARALKLDPVVITTLIVGFVLSMGVLYSEGPLFMLLLMTLLAMMARSPQLATKRPIVFGLLTAAIVLTRLDAVFFVGFVYLYYLWELGLKPKWFLAAAICGALVGGYVLSNIVFFGGAMPVSGWMKGNFPYPFPRGFAYYPFPQIQRASIGGYSLLMGWMPLVVALVTLATCRPLERMERVFLFLLFVGTSIQGSYIALFTRSHTLWPWYYVLPIVLLALSLGILVDRWKNRLARPFVLACISLAVLAAFTEKVLQKYSQAFDTIDHLNQNDVHDSTILVSDWPGAVAYYTDNNVLAADMLTSNRFEFERMRTHSNALDYLVEECDRLGKPLRHIMIVGNHWLMWDATKQAITYYDPRRYPILAAIGELKTQFEPSGKLKTTDGIDVWLRPDESPHDEVKLRSHEERDDAATH